MNIQEKRLKFDKNICVRCGTKKNLCVHHLNYDRFGNEKLSDLITLCRYCHGMIHRSSFRRIKDVEIEITKDCFLEISKKVYNILKKPKGIDYEFIFNEKERQNVLLKIKKENYGQHISKSTTKDNFFKVYIPKLRIFKCKDYSFDEVNTLKKQGEIEIKLDQIF